MAKLLIVLGAAVLLISIILGSFLSLEYPQATYVDVKQRIKDLSFDYAIPWISLLDIIGAVRFPVFYRWFYKATVTAMSQNVSEPPSRSIYDSVIADVPITIFKPPSYASKKLLPGIIYIPGGSFIIPSQESHFRLCSMLASNVTAIVFLVHQRVAPEHPFPAPLDDVKAVTEYVLWNPEEFGVRPSRIALGGDDTGAAIVISTLIDLVNLDPSDRRAPLNKIYTTFLLSPVLQIANLALPSHVFSKQYSHGIQPSEALSYYSGIQRPSSKLLNAISENLHIPFTMKIRFQPLLDFNMLNETFIPEDYIAPDLALDLSADVPEMVTWLASNADAFPLLYEDSYFSKLPYTYIQPCEHSVSRDDGLIFAKRLEKSSVSLKLALIRQAMHNDPVLRSSVFVEANRDLVRFLRRTLYKQGA